MPHQKAAGISDMSYNQTKAQEFIAQRKLVLEYKGYKVYFNHECTNTTFIVCINRPEYWRTYSTPLGLIRTKWDWNEFSIKTAKESIDRMISDTIKAETALKHRIKNRLNEHRNPEQRHMSNL